MLTALRQHYHRLAAALSAAVPSPCALCSESGTDGICGACRERFFSARPARCRRCAHRLHAGFGESAICGRCIKREPSFDETIVAADYAPPLDQLILALKFGGNLALAPLFSRLLADALFEQRATTPVPDVLVAVPLGQRRLAERGFNQALEMARPLSRALGIALEPRLIVRVRETNEQARLPPDERRKNVHGAFALPAGMGKRIQGMHVGVVDDVVTTGETMNTIATTLKRHGAARVTCLALARTPPN